MYPIKINTCIFCGQARSEVETVETSSSSSKRSKNLDNILIILFNRMMNFDLNARDLSSLLRVNKFFAKKGEIAWKGVLQNYLSDKLASHNILKLSSMEAKNICSQISCLMTVEMEHNKEDRRLIYKKNVEKLHISYSNFILQSVINHHSELLRFLIALGFNMNDGHKSIYQTPLKYSLMHGDIKCTEILLKAGADFGQEVFSSLPSEEQFVMIINELKVRDLISYPLFRRMPLLNFLFVQAYGKNANLIRIVLGAGADINTYDHNGSTALMMAVLLKCTETIQLLLGAGADVNMRDRVGRTALKYTTNAEITQMLIRAGAEV